MAEPGLWVHVHGGDELYSMRLRAGEDAVMAGGERSRAPHNTHIMSVELCEDKTHLSLEQVCTSSWDQPVLN